MSILIKGMKMPTSCVDCRFHKSIYCTLTDICTNTAQGCPLAPVPPHGRLIDADEFLKRAIETKCFRGDYALMLEELVGESTTIIEAEEGET